MYLVYIDRGNFILPNLSFIVFRDSLTVSCKTDQYGRNSVVYGRNSVVYGRNSVV